jgi:transcriptional regulator PpsR
LAHAERSVEKTIASIDAQTNSALVASIADITLQLDATGTVRQVSFNGDDWDSEDILPWTGREWRSVATVESRPKIDEMIADALAGRRVARWRHINLVDARDQELPLQFCVVKASTGDGLIALGRDLRPVAALQARLIQAQQFMERDHLRLRGVESQYRLLFDLVRDPIVMIGGRSNQILEINRAGTEFFAQERSKLMGESITSLVHPRSVSALQKVMQQVDGSGRPGEVRLRFVDVSDPVMLLVSCLRQGADTVFVLRIDPRETSEQRGDDQMMLEAIRQVTDAVVITDAKGFIQRANPAFMEMIQMAHAGQVIGEPLNRWLGRANTDLLVMINSLAQGGAVRLFSTQLIGPTGLAVPVEISGVSVQGDHDPLLAFVVRDVGRRLAGDTPANGLPRSGQDLTGLVGRMPLREIVGETVDLIEKLCIETALKITRNNRASAADMLGLSRQSLYVKLRRHDIEGPEDESEG